MPRDDLRGLQSLVLWVVVAAARVLQRCALYSSVRRGAKEATVRAFGER